MSQRRIWALREIIQYSLPFAESNGGRNREVTDVRLLQSKIVGLRKCGGENQFSAAAFYKDNFLREQTIAKRRQVARGATS